MSLRTRVDRGQTGVGAVYAFGLMIIVITGVVSIGYVYISTPAVSNADTTAESSVIASDVLYENLTRDYALGGESAPPQLSLSQIEYIFPVGGSSENADALTDHPVATRNGLSVRVVIENTTGVSSQSMLSAESGKLVAGDENPPPSASVYQKPAMIQEQLVSVKFETWQEIDR